MPLLEHDLFVAGKNAARSALFSLSTLVNTSTNGSPTLPIQAMNSKSTFWAGIRESTSIITHMRFVRLSR